LLIVVKKGKSGAEGSCYFCPTETGNWKNSMIEMPILVLRKFIESTDSLGYIKTTQPDKPHSIPTLRLTLYTTYLIL